MTAAELVNVLYGLSKGCEVPLEEIKVAVAMPGKFTTADVSVSSALMRMSGMGDVWFAVICARESEPPKPILKIIPDVSIVVVNVPGPPL
jgi:hypothetical protein